MVEKKKRWRKRLFLSETGCKCKTTKMAKPEDDEVRTKKKKKKLHKKDVTRHGASKWKILAREKLTLSLTYIYIYIYIHIYMLTHTHTYIIYIYIHIYIYIYIYIFCHPQTDCFIVSPLLIVARFVGRLKLGSKHAQLYVRLSVRPLSQQTYHLS